jgi:hypothetical protein
MRARLAFCYIAADTACWSRIGFISLGCCVYVWLLGAGITGGTGGGRREEQRAGQGKKHGRESCIRKHLLQVLTFSTNRSPIGSRIEAKDD